ncbi:MAG: hypothetical protein Q9215_005880 [Flavoplaca cf. flavocitrina]
MAPLFWAAALASIAIHRFTASAALDVQLDRRAILSQPALLPAVHWDHDHGDLSHLAPTENHNLYYAAAGISDPYLQHAFADCDTCLTVDIEKELSIEDAMHGVDVSWGTYTPSQTKSRRDSSPFAFHLGQSRSKADSRSLRRRQISDDVPGCGPAPSPEIDGFPIATCNSPTFDQDLDDKLGYFDFSETQLDASLRAFAPGFQENGPSDSQLAQRRRRSVGLVRRGFFDIFESIAKTVVNVVKEVFSEKNAVAVAKTLLKVVVAVNPIGAIVAQILTVDEKLNETIPIRLAPSGQIDSPWGQAK